MIRRTGETQRATVERVLREDGSIATYDALYRLERADGARTSITRLAAIICDLRADGWDITTEDPPGGLAVYRLNAKGLARTWTCINCGQPSSSAPEPALGGMGYGPCLTCHTRRYFRAA